MFTDLISVDELTPILDRVVLLDCRSRLGDEAWGPAQFIEGHIPGAQHADMDKDLAAPPGKRGRHPLPAQEIWIQRIRDWGISNESQVVVYDDASGAFAARAWWMLRWVGHAAVAVLDGGMQQWPGPLQSGPTSARQSSSFTVAKSLTRTIEVEQLLDGTKRTLIDARAEARWAGREEPIDLVAGHIPGAICRPFPENIGPEGRFRTATELAKRFESDTAGDVVCYCGSGVTAAHNILAMHVAGLPEPALYVDSWSGWITDPSRPVATGD